MVGSIEVKELSGSAEVKDWPMDRHDPARTGAHSNTNIPDNLTLLWKVQCSLPGTAFSSPAVVNNRVYVNSMYIYCLDANTGKLIWKYETGGEIYSSPTVVRMST